MIAQAAAERRSGIVTAAERRGRIGHGAFLIQIPGGDSVLAHALERHLFEHGYLVYVAAELAQAVAAVEAGLIALLTAEAGTALDPQKVITADPAITDERELFHQVTQQIATRDDAAQWTGGAGI